MSCTNCGTVLTMKEFIDREAHNIDTYINEQMGCGPSDPQPLHTDFEREMLVRHDESLRAYARDAGVRL